MHPQELIKKFEDSFDKISIEECWYWKRVEKKSYGYISFKGKNYIAHRLSYEIYRGPIVNKLFVLHACDNKSCVNPNHLRLGTHQQNMNDCAKRIHWKRYIKKHNKKNNVIELKEKDANTSKFYTPKPINRIKLYFDSVEEKKFLSEKFRRTQQEYKQFLARNSFLRRNREKEIFLSQRFKHATESLKKIGQIKKKYDQEKSSS